MKVLHVIETLGRGGAEQALCNLLPELIRNNVECEVVVLWGPYDLSPRLSEYGIKVYHLDLNHRWGIQRALKLLGNIVDKNHYDIVHGHLFFGRLYSSIIAKLKSTKNVVTFHNLSFIGYPPNSLWRKLRLQLDRTVSKRLVDGFLAVSTSVAEHYKEYLKLKEEIVIIPNAFPAATTLAPKKINKKSIRKEYGIGDNDFLMILPGRLISQKGHDVLLDALNILSKKNIFPKTLMFGEGPLKEEINATISHYDLDRQTFLHDAVVHDQLVEILQASDCIVVPSRFEGFGLVAAEAMSLEIPVIASAVHGLTDLVIDNVTGRLVPPEDAEALAKAILEVLEKKEESLKIAKQARQHIIDEFIVDRVSGRLKKFYNSILLGCSENET